MAGHQAATLANAENEAPQRAALYLRVSTGRQAESDLSIPDQRRQAMAFCKARGWNVVAEFVDAGLSGTDDKRPELQRLLDVASSGGTPFDAVVVHSFSRFARDHFALEYHVRKLRKHNVRLVSITQDLGDDPMSVMVRQVFALFDEYQSKENAKHVLRAMQENARQGFWNGAAAPYGYAPTALAKLTRLVQLACNPSLIFPEAEGTPAKFEALDGVIEDILSVPGRKVIVWSNYIRTIETLLARIPGAVAIYGGTPASERQEIAASFQHDPDVRVLIANPAAAGTGFTLTAASFTIYESLSWRYDHYAQSQDRNHRIGQTEPVTYLRLIAADTIEEAIVVALERKSALARSLLGDEGAGDAVSQLTKEEMCELLRSNRLPAA